jgi:hypothetical protein
MGRIASMSYGRQIKYRKRDHAEQMGALSAILKLGSSNALCIGTAKKMPGQSWNAAAFLMAEHAVNAGKSPFALASR